MVTSNHGTMTTIYRIFYSAILCILLCACGERRRTLIGKGFYYSSGESNYIDRPAPVDIEYSENGRNFSTIYKNIGSDALLHGDLVIFRTAGGRSVFGATPRDAFDITPLVQKKWGEMPISKIAKWNEDYYLTEAKVLEQALRVTLFVSKLSAPPPQSVEIEIPWIEVESLAK